MRFLHEAKFFEPLNAQMEMLTEGSKLLWEGAQLGASGMRKCSERIEELRERSSEIYIQIAERPRRTLITPIDPEDILRLSAAMKRLCDTLARAASRQEFCACQPAPAELLQKLELIHECSVSLKNAFGSFRNGALPRHCDQLRQLSERASRIARTAREKLLASDDAPLDKVRMRENYDIAHVVLTRYVDLSETLKRVKLKNG